MRVIIAGSREFIGGEYVDAISDAVAIFEQSVGLITEVVCGDADGIDTAGRLWAESNGIQVQRFPADWKKHGKKAGPIRNRQMAEYSRGLILVWDGKSRGSANMLKVADELGLATMSIVLDGAP